MCDRIPAEFWQGIEQFNQQDYYACHDTLEAIWMEAAEPEKRFYQGILQIAVALYHLSNENLRGAAMLMGEGIGRLGYYQPDYAGINVTALLAQSRAVLVAVQQAQVRSQAEVTGLALPQIQKVKP